MELRTAPICLRTEYRENPMGLASPDPRLSWHMASDAPGARQTAYRVVAAQSREALITGDSALWDSGRVEGSEAHLVPSAGGPARSGERVWWRVQQWDQDGALSAWSEPAFWEWGLLRAGDWKARWVSLPVDRAACLRDGLTLPPCSYLRKTFTLDASVECARVYASARGLYRLSVNGTRVGDDEFAPGWTDYRQHIQYQTHDITGLLREGVNVIDAVLAEGWYCGYIGFRFRRDSYGDHPELFVQANIDLADGSSVVVGTDGSWEGAHGPLEYSDLLAGERCDARREPCAWAPVHVEWTAPTAVPLVPQVDHPVRVTQELRPREIRESAEGRWIVDMGQNMVGRMRLHVQGERGTTVRLRFAEMLQPDGSLYFENLRQARATDEYVLRGGGPEEYEPTFTFHGFRYVEVSGYPGTLTADALVGSVLESDTPRTGWLETENPLVNQLIRNIEWGQRGNFLSVPTDCPQRDERLGWTGDAQVFVRTASYNREVAAFFTKWMTDVRDGQSAEGSFPNVAPLLQMDGDGAPAWGDAGVIVPWTIFLMYGDRRILEQNYDAMNRWIAYITEGNPNGLWRERISYNLSDWLSVDAQTPGDVLATAYYAYDVSLMSQIASALGRREDATRYKTLFEHIRTAFNREFVGRDATVAGRTQTAYLLALKMGLLPQDQRAMAARHLVDDIQARGGHLSTGFVGVGYLCPVLTECGYNDIAYQLLLNDTFPSWGYSIRQGATTIWERWDGWTEEKGFQDPSMNSFNHYSLGSVGEWLYRYVAGIDADPEAPGFQKFLLRPAPDVRLGSARARFLCPYGEIASEWRMVEGLFEWAVTVPANTSATAYIPSLGQVTVDGRRPGAAAGVYHLRTEANRVVCRLEAGHYQIQSCAVLPVKTLAPA